jgi:hypothetical protein
MKYVINDKWRRRNKDSSINIFWIKDWGPENIRQELVITPDDDAHKLFSIKIWLQKFRNRDLSCKNLPFLGRSPLTLLL